MSLYKTDIAVIIPCYNTPPEFLQEAIDSVKKNKIQSGYSITIVNDGSTNAATMKYLNTINDTTIQVITQQNKGLAGARNTGIKNTASEYLVFLDSDDRLKPNYIEKGTGVLNQHAETGVVYANAQAFGDGSRENFVAKPFDIVSLLLTNHIPSCVVMRRKAWEDVGGFDEGLRKFEDWEFWISIYKAGWKFHFIEQPMFEYRIQANSLLGESGEKDFRNAVAYIYKKHWDLIYETYHQLYAARIMYHNDMKRPFRSFLKYMRYKF